MSDHQTIRIWAKPKVSCETSTSFLFVLLPFVVPHCHTTFKYFQLISTVKLHSVAFLAIPQTHDIYTYSLTYFIPQRTPYKVLAQAEGTVFILHAMTWYTQTNKNPSPWYFVRPAHAVTCGTVAIIIWVIFHFPYLRIRGVSVSSIHYIQSRRMYINRKQK